MIVVENLTKKYRKKTAVDHVSIQLENFVYGLMGPNGAGKSTWIRMLCGILPPTEGTVKGIDKNTRVGYLSQRFGCFEEYTLWEQMEYFSVLKGLEKSRYSEEIDRVLAVTNLEKEKNLRCKALSGGMTRRAGIAQALLGEPQLLLLDEPTAGLDPEERNHFNSIILSLRGKLPVVISTHLVEDVAFSCEKILIMKEGRMIYQGDARETAKLAEGYACTAASEELAGMDRPYKIIRQNQEGTVDILVFDKESVRKFAQRQPTILDGYFYCIKDEKL